MFPSPPMSDRLHLGQKARPFTTGLLLTRIRALWDNETRNKREIERITMASQGGLAAGIVCGSPWAWIRLLMARYNWGSASDGLDEACVVVDPSTCRPVDILRAWTPQRVQVLADAEEERTGTNPWTTFWETSPLFKREGTFEVGHRNACWGNFATTTHDRQLHHDFVRSLVHMGLHECLFRASHVALPDEPLVPGHLGPVPQKHRETGGRDVYWFFVWLADPRTRMNLDLEIPGIYIGEKGNPSYGPRILRGAPC